MKKTVLIKNIKSKKGFSLLELLLVLGIIAALVVAAFIVYPKVQASQRAQAESNNIATIQAGVKALYTSASSFTGLTNSVAVQAKIFPDNMLSGSGSSAKPSMHLKEMLSWHRQIQGLQQQQAHHSP
jgi:prepilin-type N-terminal cleavage/methylation domain-containing protein